MSTYDKYDKRFTELVRMGEEILQKYGWTGQEYPHKFPAADEYNQWYASAKNLIEKVCSKDSNYYEQLHDLYANNKGNSYEMAHCMGVFRAAHKDFKLGMLENAKALITAEVFTDFIEQAEYLLVEQYKLPAAVLAGAVLEDSMRTLCAKNGIALSKRPKLDWMNAELCKAGVYNKNVQKQITAWAGIRNSAAHGKEDEFNEADVKGLIDGVVNFNATYLR